METYTPIEILKNKLSELKLIPEADPNLLLEYEKAILVLELVGVGANDNASNISDTKQNETKEDPRPYYERFMEAQKKNSKT
jgi:hypothetical protein